MVRGLVADWPLVAAGCRSALDARAYLLGLHRDKPFTVSPPSRSRREPQRYRKPVLLHCNNLRRIMLFP